MAEKREAKIIEVENGYFLDVEAGIFVYEGDGGFVRLICDLAIYFEEIDDSRAEVSGGKGWPDWKERLKNYARALAGEEGGGGCQVG